MKENDRISDMAMQEETDIVKREHEPSFRVFFGLAAQLVLPLHARPELRADLA